MLIECTEPRPSDVAVPEIIYIIGKLTDCTQERIKINAEAADIVSMQLFEKGHIPICPQMMSMNWVMKLKDKEIGSYEYVVKYLCFNFIRMCSAVYIMDNTVDSCGAQMEIPYAAALNKRAYRAINAIPRVVLNNELHHLVKGQEKIAALTRDRIVSGAKTYGPDWLQRNKTSEALPELLDAINYMIMGYINVTSLSFFPHQNRPPEALDNAVVKFDG